MCSSGTLGTSRLTWSTWPPVFKNNAMYNVLFAEQNAPEPLRRLGHSKTPGVETRQRLVNTKRRWRLVASWVAMRTRPLNL